MPWSYWLLVILISACRPFTLLLKIDCLNKRFFTRCSLTCDYKHKLLPTLPSRFAPHIKGPDQLFAHRPGSRLVPTVLLGWIIRWLSGEALLDAGVSPVFEQRIGAPQTPAYSQGPEEQLRGAGGATQSREHGDISMNDCIYPSVVPHFFIIALYHPLCWLKFRWGSQSMGKMDYLETTG